MGESAASDPTDDAASTFAGPVPEFVDWIVGAVVALSGLALTVGGSALSFVVDREMLREGVESGEITVIVVERELTEAEMLDLTAEVVNWTGIGLLVTGVGLVAFAVWYVVARRRAHQRVAAGEPAGTYTSYAVLGAVASTLLSFVPFSPVLGGGVAGYLEHRGSGRSTSVGALSGFLAMLPGLVIVVFVTVGLYAGLAAVGESGLAIVTTAAMLLVLLFVAAYGAGLGALGGFAGARVAESES